MVYIPICNLLLKVVKSVHFLKRKICLQKCETRENTIEADLHPKKMILCIWWDWKDIVLYEVIARNQTLNSDHCCSHLNQSKTTTDERRRELANRENAVVHQNKADLTSLYRPYRNCYNLAGMSKYARRTHTFGLPPILATANFS